jgi:hypothetical protein
MFEYGNEKTDPATTILWFVIIPFGLMTASIPLSREIPD